MFTALPTRIFFAIGLFCLLAACNPTPATPAPTNTPDPNSPEGRGLVLFNGEGRCSSCHALSPDTVIVGPSLAGIATLAETRVPGQNAEDYLYDSILRPDAYRPPGFENAQMDTNLAKSLTVQQVDDIVAFLLTLK